MKTYQIEQAMQFLKDRILDEAAHQQVKLTPAEVATLTYSEPVATSEQRNLADQVDAEIGGDAYEKKISSLIRDVYRRDVAEGMKARWDESLQSLRGEDLYVLVMVANAGVENASIADLQWYKSFLRLDFLCLAGIGIAGGLFFFTSLGSAVKSDAVRAVLFFAWVAAMWGIGEWSRRRAFRRKSS